MSKRHSFGSVAEEDLWFVPIPKGTHGCQGWSR